VLLLSAALPALGGPAEQAEQELRRLQGEWVMAALEVDGQAVPEEKIRGTTLRIKGDQYVVTADGKTYEVTLRLDPSASPKAVDMAFPDGPNAPKVGKGIYKLEGDTFVLCRAQSTEGERPAQFGTWPNTGVFMVTWKRKPR
jgi:uncharacterized protein (TIGR03067 family)